MPEHLPSPAYRILTPRLVIRCWQPADAPLFQAAIAESLEHLKPWLIWAYSEPETLQQKVELLRRFRGAFDLGQDYHYGIFSHDESQVLGGLHMRPGHGVREIGYWVHKDHINQGLATEAAGAATRVGFQVDEVRRVDIRCAVENVRSAAVPRKLGFTCEGTLRQRVARGDGGHFDTMIWTLLAEEYPTSAAASAQVEAYDAAGRRIL